ncbi:MAG: DUF192 domain-containing protein [Microcoleus sp. PH2017_10_PVI_O_A]|nr:DUF192 domain-containing protein [Microcoleus sp. PH2017_10_PVI_O_A]MCC3461461.1 DUF192 domain-containing protein [Microcoleus sp. PH2017_11_PCY_U_A]MCC3479935.1 DUF192 domain-containing protein [Microcoleus sp. PH2017_12_PCY_D_A]MCC3528591.1 DUF192 domain-containing protein [Microcoleus sp. PH2017_21_RUC_O_A]MCC3540926.1 DUF192 domain-containing protein [Microcoleus sp. PH2017_22_RUC_O_B]MCC3560567.1 DUF192 domain-containing protein [Microcoleus sp. PH2017_27_LUM_O_A]TAE80879.1 MAG: hypot
MVNIGGTFGFDFLLGTPGNDTMRGFAANDTVQGLAGNDLIFGDRDNDSIAGNEGADTLFGGQGSDTIYGGQGEDAINGDRGNDLLIGGEGKDILTGGAGDDLFVLENTSPAPTVAQADVIADFGSGNDKIVLTEGIKFSDLNISVSDNQTVMQNKNSGNYLGVISGRFNLTESNFISLFGGIDTGQLLPVSVNAIVGAGAIGLEVAKTPQEQAIGLMFRTELPDDRGMLFPIAPARNVRFWMRNVQIDLDMIFLREGIVQAIIPNVPPCFSDACPNYGPDVPVDGVIELKGGRAAELGLKVGDRIANLP